MSGGGEPVKASIDVDPDGQSVRLLLRLPQPLATSAALGRVSSLLGHALGAMADRYRVKEMVDDEVHAFELRRGMRGGLRLTLALDGTMLRMRAKVETRLHSLVAVLALLVGFLAYLLASFGFAGALARHLASVHASKFGWLIGIVVTFVVGMIGWIAADLVSRRTRRESLEDAKRLFSDFAPTLENMAASGELPAPPSIAD